MWKHFQKGVVGAFSEYSIGKMSRSFVDTSILYNLVLRTSLLVTTLRKGNYQNYCYRRVEGQSCESSTVEGRV